MVAFRLYGYGNGYDWTPDWTSTGITMRTESLQVKTGVSEGAA